MMMMMKSLIDYTCQKNLKWFIIFDQHNALFKSPSVILEFPFTLVEYLSDHHSDNLSVIVSASANNEGYPTEMKGWYTHDIGLHHYNDEEFSIWCNNFGLDPAADDLKDAFFWTGGVPLGIFNIWLLISIELNYLVKQPSHNFKEKISTYIKTRTDEIR
jgi:hypothetical protein